MVSPPMRGRGLKPNWTSNYTSVLTVAPHAGAWIETFCRDLCLYRRRVAPHAGAWIETM